MFLIYLTLLSTLYRFAHFLHFLVVDDRRRDNNAAARDRTGVVPPGGAVGTSFIRVKFDHIDVDAAVVRWHEIRVWCRLT